MLFGQGFSCLLCRLQRSYFLSGRIIFGSAIIYFSVFVIATTAPRFPPHDLPLSIPNFYTTESTLPTFSAHRAGCAYRMSRNVRRHTFWHVRPTKTKMSLRIRAVWSESSLSARRNCRLSEMSPLKVLIRRGHRFESMFSDVAADTVSIHILESFVRGYSQTGYTCIMRTRIRFQKC